MGSLHQSLVEKNSCWSLRTSTPDNLNWQLDIRPISLLRGVPRSCVSAHSAFAKKLFKQSYFPPQKWIRKKKRRKKKRQKNMLTFLLVGSDSFTLCWCLSPKLALNETPHWLCSGRQQECKQAPLRGGLPLSSPVTSSGTLARRVPKSLDPCLCWRWRDCVGSRRALTPSQTRGRRKLQETEKRFRISNSKGTEWEKL